MGKAIRIGTARETCPTMLVESFMSAMLKRAEGEASQIQ